MLSAIGAAGVTVCRITPSQSIVMVLPTPPVISARRRCAANSSQVIPSLLSELSFNHQVPNPSEFPKRVRDRTKNGGNPSKAGVEEFENDDRSFFSAWNWNGLLCFSAGDPDMYFDAVETPLSSEDGMDSNGKIVLAKTSVSTSVSTAELSNHSDESFESVEVKFREGGSVVTTLIECRGGEQQQSPHRQQSPAPQSWQQNNPAAALDHRSGLSASPDPNQGGPEAGHNPFARIRAPPAPKELPMRFLRAGKGDPIEGQRRYEATLQWRKEHDIDNILFEPHPLFEMVKRNYPHYFHLRGRRGEPVFYEQPPKTDLAALKAGGMDLPGLVRHYTMVTEFQWQYIERDDFARSITVLDLEGIKISDFVGECVEYVKMCSAFSGQHYPERAGHVIVVNVPRWFAMIWKVVKPMVDEVTLEKISIVRGQDAVFAALSEKIPVENIPPEYGGKSMKLGESPEEWAVRDLMRHNNALANGDFSCGGKAADPPCPFCSWSPARRY
mmetsp:Transcript_5012/g.10523  ORF Transcript_5012/g.10523 Transcript_5012/m.10523 type:complete len:499 (+) Transcript_5012:175-1671(+)